MNSFKKMLSVFLAGSLILGITACGNNQGSTQTTTTGVLSSFDEATAPPIDENAETGTITWLMYEDLLVNAADLVAKFEANYKNVEIKQIIVGSLDYFDKLGTLIATGDSPDIVRYEWLSFPHGISYNMYTPIDDYVDFSSDLWKGVADVAEQFAYNGKHYYAPYSLVDNFSLNYNKLVLEEAGLDDPMELYLNDEWTWEAFKDILTKWCNLSEEHIGYTGVGAMSFLATTGTKLVDITSEGEIINNMKNENVYRTMDFLQSLNKEGLIGTGYADPGAAFVDGNLLFLGMQASWAFTASKEGLYKQGIEEDMAFIPFPRDAKADKYYHAIGSYGYMIPAGAKNVKGAMDWIEFNRINETDPEIVAEAEAFAKNDDPIYFPKCSNADCGDTSENADKNGKHIFTDEENESGVSVCPVCGTERKPKFHAVYSEQQWEIYQEMKSTDGRLSMLFDNCFGFGKSADALLNSGAAGDGTDAILNGSLLYGTSYATICESSFNALESYIQPYRDRMKADAEGKPMETTAPVSETATGDSASETAEETSAETAA